MSWLLVMIISYGPGETFSSRMGEMVSEEACRFAAEAMAEQVREAGPGNITGFACIPGAEA